MKPVILTILNLGLVILFIFLFRRKNLLSFHQDGRIWLTYLAVGIITLMDEFTSIFYVPAESYRFIGLGALVFIPIHQPSYPLPHHPVHGNRRDPGASPTHRRGGLFLLLSGPGPDGLLRSRVFHHGGLYPHRLHLRSECGVQRHFLLPGFRPHNDGNSLSYHLGVAG